MRRPGQAVGAGLTRHRAQPIAALALAVLAIVAAPATAQDQVWTQTGEPVPGWEAVDDAVRTYMETWNIPGAAVALSYQGRLIFAHGYTWDSPEVQPVQPTSLFRIASMSKPITSVAIHQLIERGQLSYDTRVADALGLEPPPDGEPDPWLDEVTVDHLLYHTGGWDRDLSFDPMFHDEAIASALGVDLPISKADIATYMTGQEMQFRPGSRFAYSNYGYALLGLLIEKVAGRDYSEWVAENVFQPIGVGRPRRGHTVAGERAPGEVLYYGRVGEDPYRWNIENMDAHGGWVVSAPDYLRFMSALFDDQDSSPLLARSSIESMLVVNPLSGGSEYARGWVIVHEGDEVRYHHGGSLPGTLTMASWVGGFGLVALLNTSRDAGEFDFDLPGPPPPHDLFASVGILASSLGAALAESWIPVVASGSGSGGSLWRSDVGVLNRSTLSNRVRLRVEMEGLAVDRELELEPGEQRIVADVVSELGLSGAGSLRVFSSEPLTITSRSYNTSADGTYGQFLGGVTGPGGLGNGDSAVLIHLREDHLARSNIGILNAGRRRAKVRVDLFDGSGAQIASFTRQVDARRVKQLNRPFASPGGRSDVEVGYAVVTVLEGEEVVVYGSVVDAFTHDPTTIPMQTGSGATALHVAAAAHADGVAGSVWRTDLGLMNRGNSPASVQVTFHQTGGPDLAANLVLDPGRHEVLHDVVGLLGGDGSGSLEITSDQPILVSSRTYNQSAGGTFGQYLAGLSDTETVGASEVVWLPQLSQTAEFRTNLGLLNTGDVDGNVALLLYDAGGIVLSATHHHVAPGQRLQLQEPFRRLAGQSDIDWGYAAVEVQNGGGIVVYASVIDNRTNDPTTIPMVR